MEDKAMWMLCIERTKLSCVNIAFRMFGCGLLVPQWRACRLVEWAIDALNPSVFKTFHNVTSTSACNIDGKSYRLKHTKRDEEAN